MTRFETWNQDTASYAQSQFRTEILAECARACLCEHLLRAVHLPVSFNFGHQF